MLMAASEKESPLTLMMSLYRQTTHANVRLPNEAMAIFDVARYTTAGNILQAKFSAFDRR